MAKAEITNKMIFVSSCIETVAQELHISTTEAYKRMKDINFRDGFIISCYDALHTQSREYVTELLLGALKNWELQAKQNDEKSISRLY